MHRDGKIPLLWRDGRVGKMIRNGAVFVAPFPTLVRGSELDVQLTEDATSYNVVKGRGGSRLHVPRIQGGFIWPPGNGAKLPTVGGDI